MARKWTAKLRNEWADALASGKYPQTIGTLREKNDNKNEDRKKGYCCWGVLARVCGIPASSPILIGDSTFEGFALITDVHAAATAARRYKRSPYEPKLSTRKSAAAKAATNLPLVRRKIERRFVNMNDGGVFNFKQIAVEVRKLKIADLNNISKKERKQYQ